MKEKLELVTDFGSLRAGMIVVTKNCRRCNGAHRGMLTRMVRDTGPIDQWVWRRPHDSPCGARGPSERSVSERRVFRVVDDLEQSQSTESRKSVTA